MISSLNNFQCIYNKNNENYIRWTKIPFLTTSCTYKIIRLYNLNYKTILMESLRIPQASLLRVFEPKMTSQH